MKSSTFFIKTPRHKLKIHPLYSFIAKNDVKVNKEKFSKMCKTGCSNYGKKYSCPPYSPDFDSIMKDCDKFFVLLFYCKTSKVNSKNKYLKVIMPNTVMKSRIEKIMRELEKITKTKFLGTGSCRLCRPCRLKLNQPCKYPKKRRYSLESVGVDCNDLTKRLFNMPLLWYKSKRVPKYTSVICGIPIKDTICKKLILERMKFLISNFLNNKEK